MQIINPNNRPFIIQHGTDPKCSDAHITSRAYADNLDDAMDCFAEMTGTMPNGGYVELVDAAENRIVGSVYI